LKRAVIWSVVGAMVAVLAAVGFVLDETLDLGAIPAAGEPIDTTAIGTLTLHGVSRSIPCH
jgi:hypothetical protein